MNTREIIDEIRRLLGRHVGSEKDLLDQLLAEAEGWKMRYEELDDEEELDNEIIRQ